MLVLNSCVLGARRNRTGKMAHKKKELTETKIVSRLEKYFELGNNYIVIIDSVS